MPDARLPTRLQTILCSLLLILLSIVTAPLSFAIIFPAYIWARLKGTLIHGRRQKNDTREGARQTALVNGGRMVKSLVVCRALARAGVRVILVEEEGWGELCATRFSSSVSSFHLLPPTGPSRESRAAYVDALVRIARQERCTLFVPCSGAGTTIEDARAAEIMRNEISGFRAIVQSEKLAKVLHEKDSFMELVHSLGFAAPANHTITSIPAALEVIHSSPFPLILKCTSVLDDTGRSDLTTYPLQGDDHSLSKTRKRLQGLKIPISEDTPYALQRFIGGEGVETTEWCTHATVVDGELRAFVCCPSNDMLMTYVDATDSHVGRLAEQFTRNLVSGLAWHPDYAGTSLTGQFSLDFILSTPTTHGTTSDEKDIQEELFAIECNPRVHTASCLLPSRAFADALILPSTPRSPRSSLQAVKNGEKGMSFQGEVGLRVVKPLKGTRPRSWAAHDLPARILARFVPTWMHLHPLLARSSSFREEEKCWFWRDPTFDWEDPVPWFALGHVQWVGLMGRAVWRAAFRGVGWSRANVSTARVFEC